MTAHHSGRAVQGSVSQPQGRGPVLGPPFTEKEFTGPRSHKG